MKLGTHNSATGGRLVWWLHPISWVINPTSKCQDKSIDEQLEDGVKLFNLQVAYIGGKWRFTHGLAVYKEDVFETLAMMKACATKEEPIYFQLYLDKCFWCKRDEVAFIELAATIKAELLKDGIFMMFDPWIECTREYLKIGNVLEKISLEEHYWTTAWSKDKSWIDKIPLPKRHAKMFNAKYKSECKSEYLMLDFYNYG
ncbi:MAG: hypothetical protein J6V47_05515 [Bacteroidaceae bacterium]|nr:hypothetical protein [Bacteroidaceae bacterium]